MYKSEQLQEVWVYITAGSRSIPEVQSVISRHGVMKSFLEIKRETIHRMRMFLTVFDSSGDQGKMTTFREAITH